MADQGRWFKLWVSAPYDPDLGGGLSNEDFGRWCKLGCYLKVHGTNGTIRLRDAKPLKQLFEVADQAAVLAILRRLPNCDVREEQINGVSHETVLTVTWRNWQKYQGDMSTERVRHFREMKRSKRRGEEKRGDERKTVPAAESAAALQAYMARTTKLLNGKTDQPLGTALRKSYGVVVALLKAYPALLDRLMDEIAGLPKAMPVDWYVQAIRGKVHALQPGPGVGDIQKVLQAASRGGPA